MCQRLPDALPCLQGCVGFCDDPLRRQIARPKFAGDIGRCGKAECAGGRKIFGEGRADDRVIAEPPIGGCRGLGEA